MSISIININLLLLLLLLLLVDGYFYISIILWVSHECKWNGQKHWKLLSTVHHKNDR